MNDKINCYEKIINNYLEIIYLDLLMVVKSQQEVLKVLFRSFEKIFSVNFHQINLLNFKAKIKETIIEYTKKYIKENGNCLLKVDNYDEEYKIPSELYLLNFNLYKYFNDVDNQIIIGLLIYKKDINEMANVLNFDDEYIKERFISIIIWMRTYFINTIKNSYLKKIK